ncbi:hypothetical protein CLAIMM_10943 [Cladophialophora immunda]|nr:hypothetical protein CLAIMM_10943 [Cladophialophora immunda]
MATAPIVGGCPPRGSRVLISILSQQPFISSGTQGGITRRESHLVRLRQKLCRLRRSIARCQTSKACRGWWDFGGQQNVRHLQTALRSMVEPLDVCTTPLDGSGMCHSANSNFLQGTEDAGTMHQNMGFENCFRALRSFTVRR